MKISMTAALIICFASVNTYGQNFDMISYGFGNRSCATWLSTSDNGLYGKSLR